MNRRREHFLGKGMIQSDHTTLCMLSFHMSTDCWRLLLSEMWIGIEKPQPSPRIFPEPTNNSELSHIMQFVSGFPLFTFEKPSRPTAAFCWNRFKEKSSTTFDQRDNMLPAEIVACWVNCVLYNRTLYQYLPEREETNGACITYLRLSSGCSRYTMVSWTDSKLAMVRFWLCIVNVFFFGSMIEISRTYWVVSHPSSYTDCRC